MFLAAISKGSLGYCVENKDQVENLLSITPHRKRSFGEAKLHPGHHLGDPAQGRNTASSTQNQNRK